MEEDRVGKFCNSLMNSGFSKENWDKLSILEKFLFYKEACILLSSKELKGDRISAFRIYVYCIKNRFLPAGFYDPDIYRRRNEESAGKSLLDAIQTNDYWKFNSLVNLMNAEAISFNNGEPLRYAISLKREQMAKEIKAIVLKATPLEASIDERNEILLEIDPNLVYNPNVFVFFVHHPFTLSNNTGKMPNIPLIRANDKIGELLKQKGGVWNEYYKGWMFIGNIPHYIPSPIHLQLPQKAVIPAGGAVFPTGKTDYPVIVKPVSLGGAKVVGLAPVPVDLGAPIPVPSKPVDAVPSKPAVELGTPIPPSPAKQERKSHDHVKPVIPAPPPIGEKDPLGDDDPVDKLIKKLSDDKRSGGKKRSKSSEKYDKEYQRCDTPDEDSPVRIFYETLYEEKPNSRLAICWLVHRGAYEDNDEGQRLLEKYKELDNAGETITVGCRAT